jgi:hypothetical protein
MEAEAIAADVLGRLHSEQASQHAKYAATYIGGQPVVNADALLEREEALSKAADWIVQNMVPEDIKSRSAYAARMVKTPSAPTVDVDSLMRGYDSSDRYQMYSGGADY